MIQGRDSTTVPAVDTMLGRTIYVRRTVGASRLTLLQGEHEWISRAAIAWPAAQQRRR